jgi:hypothetical protein
MDLITIHDFQQKFYQYGEYPSRFMKSFEIIRRSESAMNQRAFENEAELRREGFVIQKELIL